MRRVIQLALILALAGGAVFIWRHIFPSPERRIRRQMETLQELVSFRSADGNIAVLAGLQRLGSLFTKDAEVLVDAQGWKKLTLTGRDSIVQAAGVARREIAGDLDVEFLDVVVTLGADKRSAVVEATGTARQKSTNDLWIHELRFHFIKTDDGWQISEVETVRTLTRREGESASWVALPQAA